ncbi:MAG: D-alanine--D-alanine ligase A [Flammeovirgaceae bacterium]|nr:D-alanine--D-alanine ligase A [Flammeovirgaceae bacterium]
MSKKNLIILFGGRSVEHEISVRSAINVVKYIDLTYFNVSVIGISKKGSWFLLDHPKQNIETGNEISLSLSPINPRFEIKSSSASIAIQIVFPILHGTDGEDGSVQGLIKCINVILIGSNVLGSALSMDKIISKKLLEHAGIPVVPYMSFTKGEKISFAKVKKKLGIPFIVKAANLGSSVGISKVNTSEEFDDALAESFKYGHEILIESFVNCRELECGILGNEPLSSTLSGEIILLKNYDFYTYDAKYQDKSAIRVEIPAQIPTAVHQQIKALCEKAFLTVKCNDFARVDVFLTPENEIFINEINTIPGFTDDSMFPNLWENMGISPRKLISKIIEISEVRWKQEQQYITDLKSPNR